MDEQRLTHVQDLVNHLTNNSPIYKYALASVQVVGVSPPGVVTFHLALGPEHMNSKSGLHGAVSGTIVDFSTSVAIAASDMRSSTGASVDMHMSYLSSASVGDTLEIVATAERVGGNLAYTTARINKLVEGGDSKPVVLGQHTKFVKLPGQAKG